ncbi:MAG: flagellar basal body rod protein FlgB [Anaerovoracaceae bacterium]
MLKDTVTQSLIQKALDGTWQRQMAIAHNIANHETPGFKALSVDFEQALKTAVGRTTGSDVSTIANARISVSVNRGLSQRADGNSVDLDKENVNLARTQIQYQYLTRTLSDYYARMRYAISEGKR